MSTFTTWLEQKVAELADQMSSHPVFDSEQPASPDELMQLRALCAIHRFLCQELDRRTSGRSAAVDPMLLARPAVTCCLTEPRSRSGRHSEITH